MKNAFEYEVELAASNQCALTYSDQAINLQRLLTAAEQRNAELVELLRTHTNHVATLCDVMFRFGLGMDKEPEQKMYSALAQQQVVFAALKPTESGASDEH